LDKARSRNQLLRFDVRVARNFINRFGNLGVEEITEVPLIEDISYIMDYLK